MQALALSRAEPDVVRPLTLGLVLAVGVFGGMILWSNFATLSGAVVAPGQVVLDSNVKKIQHPTGGIVGAVLVRNGDVVEAGDVLVRLDETQTRANLGVVVSQLVQLIGRRARLEAEQAGNDDLRFPAELMSFGADGQAVADSEMQLFLTRRVARIGQKEQLTARIGQSREEIKGLTAQQAAKEVEIRLMHEELSRVKQLHDRELLPTTRLLSVQRDLARLDGEWGVLVAQIARLRGQISEVELQIIGVDQNTRSDAGKELRDIEARIAELVERRTAAEDQLKRIELKAPQAGIIHELNVNTVGGVIGPGETIMQVVPRDDKLVVDTKVMPSDIDQITVGQKTILRFSAFNQRTTPEINGTVKRVGADLTREQQNNAVFYSVRIEIDPGELLKLHENQKLVPGMPVEAYVETGARTALSYFMKPLSDQLFRTFREK